MRDLIWEDMSDADRAQEVLAHNRRERSMKVPRNKRTLPCGERLLCDRAQHNPSRYVSHLDSKRGTWQWSEAARKQNPGLGKTASGVVRRYTNGR